MSTEYGHQGALRQMEDQAELRLERSAPNLFNMQKYLNENNNINNNTRIKARNTKCIIQLSVKNYVHYVLTSALGPVKSR